MIICGTNCCIWWWSIYIFEIQADLFASLERIQRAFGQVKYKKTNKNVSRYFKEAPNNIFIVKFRNFTTRIKVLEFKEKLRFLKKIYTNHSSYGTFWRGVIFSWGGEIFQPVKMLVFAMIIMFLTFLGLG